MKKEFSTAKQLLDETFVRCEHLDFEDDGHGPFMAYKVDEHSYITALFDEQDGFVYVSHKFFGTDTHSFRIKDCDDKSWLDLRSVIGQVRPGEITKERLEKIKELAGILFKENSIAIMHKWLRK